MIRFFTAIVISSAVLVGCATPRTKWTDPKMRVMIDPVSIDEAQYALVAKALVETGRWVVVDRRDGFRAVKTEQERLHRIEPDRYADKEKFAHWRKLYGVGAVVVASSQCSSHQTIIMGRYFLRCRQVLLLVDANTAEILNCCG